MLSIRQGVSSYTYTYEHHSSQQASVEARCLIRAAHWQDDATAAAAAAISSYMYSCVNKEHRNRRSDSDRSSWLYASVIVGSRRNIYSVVNAALGCTAVVEMTTMMVVVVTLSRCCKCRRPAVRSLVIITTSRTLPCTHRTHELTYTFKLSVLNVLAHNIDACNL